MRRGLKSSIDAAYTKQELEAILSDIPLSQVKVNTRAFGLSVSGIKK